MVKMAQECKISAFCNAGQMSYNISDGTGTNPSAPQWQLDHTLSNIKGGQRLLINGIRIVDAYHLDEEHIFKNISGCEFLNCGRYLVLKYKSNGTKNTKHLERREDRFVIHDVLPFNQTIISWAHEEVARLNINNTLGSNLTLKLISYSKNYRVLYTEGKHNDYIIIYDKEGSNYTFGRAYQHYDSFKCKIIEISDRFYEFKFRPGQMVAKFKAERTFTMLIN